VTGRDGAHSGWLIVLLLPARRTRQVSECSLEALVGQIHSWSGYTMYRKGNPDAPDPAIAFQAALGERLERAGATQVTWTRETTLLLAFGPQPLSGEAL
jgi:hypothetical protein